MAVGSPERFGTYEVEELLGSGSFADVYLCFHPALKTRVAVKVLHSHLARQADLCDRFVQEAQVLWRAETDRVIAVTHVDELADGRPYFVMRWADRGTLEQLQIGRNEAGQRFTLRETIGLVTELVDALEVLRDRSLVHRDLKPSNVLFRSLRTLDHSRTTFGLPPDERLMLADFGLAKTLGEGTNLLSQIGGTPLYMAPELASLVEDCTWKADLFSIAVIAYELATGRVPWPNRRIENVRDVDLGSIRLEDARPDFPLSMGDIIRRALSPEPMDRHESPSEFASDLASLLSDSEVEELDSSTGEAAVQSLVKSAESASAHAAFGSRSVASSLVESALDRLDGPIRIGVIGGNRLGPVPLALRLVGERPPPGEAALFGSIAARFGYGHKGVSAQMPDGSSLAGDLTVNRDGELRIKLPVAPWHMQSIELRFDRPELKGTEVIDLPHTVMRRDPDLAQRLYQELDVVIIGLSSNPREATAAVEEVLALGVGTSTPFAAIGVAPVGSALAALSHPALLSVRSADESTELMVLLDEVLEPTRRPWVRASAALMMLGLHQADAAAIDDLASGAPDTPVDVWELLELRRDLRGSALADSDRAMLHRVLGRRAPSARLGVSANVSVTGFQDAGQTMAEQLLDSDESPERVFNALSRLLNSTTADPVSGGDDV
ncbi:MAG: serine/threonine-protein kinase [Acidimicrobiales bacterium]